MAEVSDKEYMLMKKVAKAMILTRHHITYGPGNASESLDGSEGRSWAGTEVGRKVLQYEIKGSRDNNHPYMKDIKNDWQKVWDCMMTFLWTYYCEAGNCSDHQEVCACYLRETCPGEKITFGSHTEDHYFCVIGDNPKAKRAIIADPWCVKTQPVLLEDCIWWDKDYGTIKQYIMGDGVSTDCIQPDLLKKPAGIVNIKCKQRLKEEMKRWNDTIGPNHDDDLDTEGYLNYFNYNFVVEEGKKIDYIPKSVAAAKEASKYWTSVRKVLKIAGSHYNSRLPKLRGWKEIKAKRERVEIKKLK